MARILVGDDSGSKAGAKLAELRVRQAELYHALDAVNIQPPTRQELADLAEQVRVAVSQGPTPARKRLLHTLVHEVQGRDAIFPVFPVPEGQPPAPWQGVRTMYGSRPRQDSNLRLCPAPLGVTDEADYHPR